MFIIRILVRWHFAHEILTGFTKNLLYFAFLLNTDLKYCDIYEHYTQKNQTHPRSVLIWKNFKSKPKTEI